MISKKKEIFLLTFLILLQSCSGGRIGNFLESSFNDFDKINQEEGLQKNLKTKKVVLNENKNIYNKSNEKEKRLENPKYILENKKDMNLQKENKEVDSIKIKKLENPKNVLENKKDLNLEKIPKQKNNNIKNLSKKRKIDLQSYKIIFILKDVDPKDPTEELSAILSNSEVNFEIEKIERILD